MNLPKYVDMWGLSQAIGASNEDMELEGDAALAIVTAALAGNYSATVTYTSGSSQDARENLIARLRADGYRVTPAANDMSVNWSRYAADPIA